MEQVTVRDQNCVHCLTVSFDFLQRRHRRKFPNPDIYLFRRYGALNPDDHMPAQDGYTAGVSLQEACEVSGASMEEMDLLIQTEYRENQQRYNIRWFNAKWVVRGLASRR